MKTLDEVIEKIEEFWVCPSSDEVDEYCELLSIKDDALQYLKAYKDDKDDLTALRAYWAEQQANPALTWDELKTMVGKPVWVEYNFHIGNKDFRDNSKRWCIIREFKPWHDTEIIITDNGFVLSKNEQVTDWQAYRKERYE